MSSNAAQLLEDVQNALLAVDGTGHFHKSLAYPERFKHVLEHPAFGDDRRDDLDVAPMQFLVSDEAKLTFSGSVTEVPLELIHIIRFKRARDYGASLAERQEIHDYRTSVLQGLALLQDNIRTGSALVSSWFVGDAEQGIIESDDFWEIDTFFTLICEENLK